MHTLRTNGFLIDNARSWSQGIHQQHFGTSQDCRILPILVLNDTLTGAGVQEECKDSQQLQEPAGAAARIHLSESIHGEQLLQC